jgi:acetyl-CoA C-acetyltransferase
MPQQNDPVVIVSALRTPIGNFQGCLQSVTAPHLGATIIKALLKESGISPEKINEIVLGCVLPAGLGQAPARQAALQAGLPVSSGATTLNKVCGSGMKAVMIANDMLLAGTHSIMIAGGMESMSNAPYLLPKARQGYRMGHQTALDHMLYDGLEDAYDNPGKSMGYFAEECAQHFHFTREAQDAYALESLKRAKQATEDGTFSHEIAPITTFTKQGEKIISQDEGPLTVSAAKIPTLRPAFAKDGTVTAANSSSISDGAAALLLMRKSTAEQNHLQPLATIVAHSSFAQTPGDFPTAPIGAIKNLLEKCKWQIEDVDLFEINEAFAVVAMAAIQELKLPPEKVNLHGGGCVLGHPIGASGARILVTLIHALKKYNLKKGIAAICLGGGEAVAMAIVI